MSQWQKSKSLTVCSDGKIVARGNEKKYNPYGGKLNNIQQN